VSEPLVLALLAVAAPSEALAAGFEEEGVPLTVEAAEGAPEALAREAARRAILGIGVGGDRERLVLVLAAGPARPYLEAPVAEARAFGHDAARIAARRPLRLTALYGGLPASGTGL
jgi:hypothetical protein